MSSGDLEDGIDIPFSVPFTHRLRFTHDVFGSDRATLLDLLEPSSSAPARAQWWIDQCVADAHPWLREAIDYLSTAFSDRLGSVGNIQYVPGGEEIKNDIHILERMLKVMNGADLDRRSYVVAVGGGAMLDAVGFAAAIAHRGIRLIRLPTTTLAQADSGVGVKNGVNLFSKKNWVGSFAVPWAVVNDARLLETLSDRDYRCGFAEAVKVALLKDPTLFARIEQSCSALRRRDPRVSREIIAESARWHLKHITRGGDPFEALEARPLDFGHWSAHRLESVSQYRLRHGEAVAIGLAIDVLYSTKVRSLSLADGERIVGSLSRLGFDFHAPELAEPDLLLDGLEEFRQHLGGRLTITLLDGIGQPVDIHEIDRYAMIDAIAQVAEIGSTARDTSSSH